jgi:hypothetical protein
VTFNPNAPGTRTAKLTFKDSDGSSPQITTVSGLGTLVELSPTLLDFGGVALGTTVTLSSTLTNIGSTTVTINSIRANTDYTVSNNCGSSVAPGAMCTINVTFAPASSGPRPGALNVVSSDPASPERIDLVGRGLGIVLSPAKLSFGSQLVGTTSNPMTVTIINTNKSGILTGAVTATDDFIVSSNNCPANLGAGQSCAVQVEFAPDETGATTGTLYVSNSDASSPETIPISGIGK